MPWNKGESIHYRIKAVPHKKHGDHCKSQTGRKGGVFCQMQRDPAVIPVYDTNKFFYKSSQQDLTDANGDDSLHIIDHVKMCFRRCSHQQIKTDYGQPIARKEGEYCFQ